jgi:hypothetical protein
LIRNGQPCPASFCETAAVNRLAIEGVHTPCAHHFQECSGARSNAGPGRAQPKAGPMNDKLDSITIDRALLMRLASWGALAVGALLLLWPVSLTVFGTTVTGDPAILFILRTGEILAKMRELADNPFGGLATGPMQSALFWAWARVILGGVLVLSAASALLRGRSPKRAAG